PAVANKSIASPGVNKYHNLTSFNPDGLMVSNATGAVPSSIRSLCKHHPTRKPRVLDRSGLRHAPGQAATPPLKI
ncbi:MAG TPA: hypothetical protein PKA43_10325, partial [Candidatus Competibacter phosphatis]|nr:hypothetical protein [Candidatus Competibacter phosphatis]